MPFLMKNFTFSFFVETLNILLNQIIKVLKIIILFAQNRKLYRTGFEATVLNIELYTSLIKMYHHLTNPNLDRFNTKLPFKPRGHSL